VLVMMMMAKSFSRATLYYDGGYLPNGQPSYMQSTEDTHLTHITKADFETTDRPDE
jgi:hypothetical protein